MAGVSNSGGQRGNLSSGSGRKERSPTSTSHKGSRVDPSHLTEKARDTRAKKVATAVKAADKKAAKAKKKK